MVIAETNDFVGEALIGLEVCQEFGLPALVTFASVQPEKTYDGYPYVDACKVLADAGAAVVGLNCSRGPATMLPLLEQIRAAVDIPIAAQPVPYRTDAAAGLRVARLPGRSARLSRSNSSRSRTPASRWPTSPGRQPISVPGTSGSAAAAHRITCGPWRRRSAARHPPADTRRRWTLHPVLGTTGDAGPQEIMGGWCGGKLARACGDDGLHQAGENVVDVSGHRDAR